MKLSTRIKNRFKSRSSKKTVQSQIPFRLNFLLWTVGVLLLVLAIRLFYLQVLNGDAYKAEVNRSDTSVETNSVQRGMIYDSTGKVLVGNEAHQAITYTKSESATATEIYKTANTLGKYLTVSTSKLTTRNKQDYFLASEANVKKVLAQIPGSSKLSDSAKADKELAYLDKHPSFYKLSASQKNKAMIYAEMSGAYSLSTIYLKESGVTSAEVA